MWRRLAALRRLALLACRKCYRRRRHRDATYELDGGALGDDVEAGAAPLLVKED